MYTVDSAFLWTGSQNKRKMTAELDNGGYLEQILLRDPALLTMEDIEKVAAHFRWQDSVRKN